jgi:hypothetical protein
MVAKKPVTPLKAGDRAESSTQITGTDALSKNAVRWGQAGCSSSVFAYLVNRNQPISRFVKINL